MICKLGLHKWEYTGVFERRCQRCGRVEVFKLLVCRWMRWEE